MKCQVLFTVWCNISGEAAGEILSWSLLEMKGLRVKHVPVSSSHLLLVQSRRTCWNLSDFYVRRRESVTVSFNYRTPDRRTEDFVEVYLHPNPDEVVVWSSPEGDLDAAVLQLDTRGMPPNYRLPPPLGHLHGDAGSSSTLYFIAHDKDTDRSNRVICLKCPVVKWDALDAPVELFMRHRLSDARRTLLKTTLRHGSSGSPGFDEHGRLVVMYAKGIHDTVVVVEQAVNIKAIKELMQRQRPDLAQRLFPE